MAEYTEEYNAITGQALPIGKIYQSSGLVKHIKKRHPEQEKNISSIPAVISRPDYIGHNDNEPNSVEFVKRISENVMVCVKLAQDKNTLYVATVFTISESKLNNRIFSGRLKKC